MTVARDQNSRSRRRRPQYRPPVRAQVELLESRAMLDCDGLAFVPADELFSADGVFGTWQQTLDEAAYIGRQLPFVGDQLADSVPFGLDIREALNTAYTTAIADGVGAMHEVLEHALTEVLGPANYDLLDEAVAIEFDADACVVTATVDLSRTLAAWESPNWRFDVGLASLPIYASAEGGIELQMGFDLSPFTLSLNLDSGTVALDTDETTFDLELTAGFAPDASLSAQVGFLHMQISDGLGEFPTDDELSQLEFGLGVEFGPNFTVAATEVIGTAGLRLHFQTEANANLPKISTDFILDYDLTSGAAPEVAFDNVSIGLGDMVSKLLGPVIEVVQPVLEPLEFVMDLISDPIPVLSDLGLGDVSVLQIATSLADIGSLPPDITAYVRLAQVVDRIVDFAAMLEQPECVAEGCSDVMINFGEFPLSTINGDLRSLESKILEPGLNDTRLSSLSIGNFADLDTLIDRVDDLPLPDSIKSNLTNSLQDVQQQLNNGYTLDFPILDNPASLLFQWLIGQNADIFRVEAGVTLPAGELDLSGPMPIGVDGGLRGGFEPSIHIGLGYDTFGFRRFLDNVRHDSGPSAVDFLDGFYITGDSELSIDGFLEAYVALNALVFSVEASGGISANLTAEVIDSTEDPAVDNVDGDPHKVRFLSEMDTCAFRLAGDIRAGIALSARLGVQLGPLFLGVEHRWDLAQMVIASFDTSCVANPLQPPVEHILGEKTDAGVLTLYVGDLAGDRSLEVTEIDEAFTLTPAAPDPDNPSPEGQSIRVNAFGVSQVFHGVSQVLAEMGSGQDTLTLASGILVPVEVYGGSDDDLLRSFAEGAVTFYGDDGADQLQGGSGDSSLLGGPGNDTLIGVGNPLGNTVLEGGDDDDQLYGGSGTTSIQADAGHDQIFAGPGNTDVAAGSGNDLIVAGSGKLSVLGGDGDDTLSWSIGDGSATFNGQGGDDRLGMIGSNAANTFVVTQQLGLVQVRTDGPAGPLPIVSESVEEVSLDGLAGADRILVQPLAGSSIKRLSINLTDNLGDDHATDLISIHGTPIRDVLVVEALLATLSDMPAHEAQSRGGIMRISGFRSDHALVDDSYEILAMNQLDRILVNSHDANDLIEIDGVTGPTWIDTSSGNDQVAVTAVRAASVENDSGDYHSEVQINVGAGSNGLSVTEQLTAIEDTLQVTDRTISSDLLPGINYQSLDGGSFGQGIVVTAGDQNDFLQVLSTRRGATTTVQAGAGKDQLRVASLPQVGEGNLDSIRGPLVLDGGSGQSTITLFDTDDASPNLLVALNDALLDGKAAGRIDGLAGPRDEVPLHVVDSANQVLEIFGSDRPAVTQLETFVIHQSTQTATIIDDQAGDAEYQVERTQGSLQIFGGPGDERVDVTRTAQIWSDLQGELTFAGGGGLDRLEVHDAGSGELTFYELTDGQVTRAPGASGAIRFDDELEFLNLATAHVADTIVVSELPSATQVVLDQSEGGNILVGPATGADWDVTGPDAGRLGPNVSFIATQTLVGGGATHRFSILAGGDISGAIIGSPTGHDILDYSQSVSAVTIDLAQAVASGVASLTHLDEFIGGPQPDTLLGPSQNVDWTLTGPATGELQAVGVSLGWQFSSVEHLTGGALADRFLISGAGSAQTLDGAGGIDELNYASLATAVAVDLQQGTATRLSAVVNIENVTGGSGDDTLAGTVADNVLDGQAGNDLLLGRGGNDTLRGQAGRDLLIGGIGADAIFGGDDDDLLIGGTTQFDEQRRTLVSLLNEWQRTDLSYGRRINNLRNGTGLNAPSQLIAAAIFADGAVDQLFGGNGDDWFWAEAIDVVLGATAAEQIN